MHWFEILYPRKDGLLLDRSQIFLRDYTIWLTCGPNLYLIWLMVKEIGMDNTISRNFCYIFFACPGITLYLSEQLEKTGRRKTKKVYIKNLDWFMCRYCWIYKEIIYIVVRSEAKENNFSTGSLISQESSKDLPR